MGRYRSDESEEDQDSYISRKHKTKKKSKKRRGQSGSGSDSGGSHVSSSRGKKSKRRRGHASRSPSLVRSKGRSSRRARSRSRSASYERHHSRRRRDRRQRSRSGSRSLSSQRGRYSRSPYYSKSRSPSARESSRRSRSRSQSRGHRRRSRSYSRGRGSPSGDRSQSRRSSPESRASEASGDLKRMSLREAALTPAQQAEERMRLALKAAAAADEKLRQLPASDRGSRHSSPSVVGSGGQPRFSSHEDSLKFADSVSAIDSGNFKQTAFKSSRSGKTQNQEASMFDRGSGQSHEDAIFGSLAVTGFTIKPDPDTKPLELDPETIIHPSLFCDPEDKLDRWIERLTQLRKRKLEGDAL